MTWNHLIKIMLWIIGIFIYVGSYILVQESISKATGSRIMILIYVAAWLTCFITSIMIIVTVSRALYGLYLTWKDGDFDDVLDEPIFKKRKQYNLLAVLKENLKEAERINDLEEIHRLKQSIEIHKR